MPKLVKNIEKDNKQEFEGQFEFVDLKLNRLKNPLIEIVWMGDQLMVISKKNWFKLNWERNEIIGKPFFSGFKAILKVSDDESIVGMHLDMDIKFLYLILRLLIFFFNF